jgi:hypothetical protein
MRAAPQTHVGTAALGCPAAQVHRAAADAATAPFSPETPNRSIEGCHFGARAQQDRRACPILPKLRAKPRRKPKGIRYKRAAPKRGCPISRVLCEKACPELAEGWDSPPPPA